MATDPDATVETQAHTHMSRRGEARRGGQSGVRARSIVEYSTLCHSACIELIDHAGPNSFAIFDRNSSPRSHTFPSLFLIRRACTRHLCKRNPHANLTILAQRYRAIFSRQASTSCRGKNNHRDSPQHRHQYLASLLPNSQPLHPPHLRFSVADRQR